MLSNAQVTKRRVRGDYLQKARSTIPYGARIPQHGNETTDSHGGKEKDNVTRQMQPPKELHLSRVGSL